MSRSTIPYPTESTFAMRLDEAVCHYLRKHYKEMARWSDSDFTEKQKKEILKKLTSLSDSTCRNWLEGGAYPPVKVLIRLAQQLGYSVSWLLGTDQFDPNPTVSIIEDRAKYVAERDRVISSSKNELWIQVRIGYTLHQNTSKFVALMDAGVKLRLLICHPKDVPTMEMVARRGYKGINSRRRAARDINTFVDKLIGGSEEIGKEEKLDIMLVRYFPSTVMYFSDPESDSGMLFSVTANSKEDPELAPVLVANKKPHNTIFNHYLRQYKLLWNYAAELAEAPPERFLKL